MEIQEITPPPQPEGKIWQSWGAPFFPHTHIREKVPLHPESGGPPRGREARRTHISLQEELLPVQLAGEPLPNKEQFQGDVGEEDRQLLGGGSRSTSQSQQKSLSQRGVPPPRLAPIQVCLSGGGT